MYKYSVVFLVLVAVMGTACVGIQARGEQGESGLLGVTVPYQAPADAPLTCSKQGTPKNIIFMIGDGMGLNTICAARAATTGAGAKMHMQRCDYTAFAMTHSANAIVTDSAASGTALLCGEKTNNGTLGQTPDGGQLTSLLMKAEEMGKWTGVVTTDDIVGATPASSYAHVENRGEEDRIFGQLLETEIEVAVGGGIARLTTVPDGWQSATTADEFDKADLKDGRVLALLAPNTPKQDAAETRLDVSELTREAIEKLSASPNGFFLLVEGAQIDKAAHGGKAQLVLNETADFDEAVGEALAFAERDQNTLVVITADHETGAVSMPEIKEVDGNAKVRVAFNSGSHSGVMVPVMAAGVGAPAFHGFLDNTEISRMIESLMAPEAK